MALKLEMSKAYDMVEQDFLINTMITMGFSPKWCSQIYQCISSLVFQILINGSSGKPFCLARGLKQGDALSPYLFLLTVKGLPGMPNSVAQNGFL